MEERKRKRERERAKKVELKKQNYWGERECKIQLKLKIEPHFCYIAPMSKYLVLKLSCINDWMYGRLLLKFPVVSMLPDLYIVTSSLNKDIYIIYIYI